MADVPGIRRGRFTTSHPSDFTPDIVAAIDETPALCDHVHLPVQSGSTKILRAMQRTYTRDAYLEKIADSHTIYRGPGGRVHPAFYLHVANRALSRNVKLGPWIHVGSVVRHLAAARIGDTLTMRGRVRSLFEKKGKEFVELDLVMTAGSRAIAHILHTAIYRLPAPA